MYPEGVPSEAVANLTRITFDPTKLKAAREKTGLSQSEVAAKVGVGKAAISKIELGEGKPSADVLVRLCKLYQLDVAEISSKAALKQRRHKARFGACEKVYAH